MKVIITLPNGKRIISNPIDDDLKVQLKDLQPGYKLLISLQEGGEALIPEALLQQSLIEFKD